MTKLCEVLDFNKTTHIVIAKYDGMQIQFVTDKDSFGHTVYIEKNASGYEIVEEAECKKPLKVTRKKDKIDKEEVSDIAFNSDDSELT